MDKIRLLSALYQGDWVSVQEIINRQADRLGKEYGVECRIRDGVSFFVMGGPGLLSELLARVGFTPYECPHVIGAISIHINMGEVAKNVENGIAWFACPSDQVQGEESPLPTHAVNPLHRSPTMKVVNSNARI